MTYFLGLPFGSLHSTTCAALGWNGMGLDGLGWNGKGWDVLFFYLCLIPYSYMASRQTPTVKVAQEDSAHSIKLSFIIFLNYT